MRGKGTAADWLSQVRSWNTLDTVVLHINPQPGEAEAGGSTLPGQPEQQ